MSSDQSNTMSAPLRRAPTSGAPPRRRQIPRPQSSWRQASHSPDGKGEFCIPAVSSHQSFLDTITAHYAGAHSAGPVRWFRTTESATVTLVVRGGYPADGIAQLLDGMPPEVDEVLVLGADTGTPITLGGRLDVRVDPGRGVTDARGALAAATGDIIVVVDAGGGLAPREIRHLLHFLTNGYDFVKGSRFVCGGASAELTGLRRLGNRCVLAVFHCLYRSAITDLCYLSCAFHRRDLERLGPETLGEDLGAELTLRALRAGLRIAEIPISEQPQPRHKSSGRVFRDGARVLKTIIRMHGSAHRGAPGISAAA